MQPAAVHEGRGLAIEEALDRATEQRELRVAAEGDHRREVEPSGEPGAYPMEVAARDLEGASRLDQPQMIVHGFERHQGRGAIERRVAPRPDKHDEQDERGRQRRARKRLREQARPRGASALGSGDPGGQPPLESARRCVLRQASLEDLAQSLLDRVLVRAVRTACEVSPHRLVHGRREEAALVVEEMDAGVVALGGHRASP